MTLEQEQQREEQLEKIGCITDRIDNLIAASNLGVPVEQKFEYTLKILAEIKSDLRAIIVESGGEDWWNNAA